MKTHRATFHIFADPFSFDAPPVLPMELIDLQCSSGLKAKFREVLRETTVTVATSSSSGTVPYVVTFGHKAFTQTANKRTTACKVCGIRINDAELHQAAENAQGPVRLCDVKGKQRVSTASKLIKVNSAVNYMQIIASLFTAALLIDLQQPVKFVKDFGSVAQVNSDQINC